MILGRGRRREPDPVIQALKELRISKGMTQRALERRSGISQRTVSRIENAYFNPSIATVRLMADALGAGLFVREVTEIEGHDPEGRT